ncbi:hypothetical protein [Rhodobacter capsulatus]|uniref:Kinetochore Spc7 domain protein n=1 Tax=Rhodobacter capsulatus (strain ATCC BAA-309 / NBRC 16581 / SB1003) TaxID=272942 RepID=D5ASF5_RHOCB|nr:hypothetical protein [Rhodobacter capsulatus]ADE85046.1 kinetochore Spc7 domain protein [Rhodobacter capsulatus SB 1003]ETD02074.1 hypothetical protein U714_07680 [Rhodobacter capsulatus DE442]ETD77748.1 hypothetical protein U717_07855 [Rhodobacter capsulatus R121]ETE54106.1 hypothetical protein U715_07855 [Rhodobacter capsulatus Y262]MDS0926700.1 hypothetical protein [Rhodobacter capsulatus]
MSSIADLVLDHLGQPVETAVLFLAGLLRSEGTPGVVVVLLLAAMLGFLAFGIGRMRGQAVLLRRFAEVLDQVPVEEIAQGGLERVAPELGRVAAGNSGATLREAWDEFSETLIIDDRAEPPVVRNTARPGVFFNIEDLGYGPGFLRILPGMFVSVGLALTFLGLIAALHQMSDGQITSATMQNLLKIASAKFIMSLTGLVCSIVLTIQLRISMGGVEAALHRLVRLLEERLSFASLEQIALEQLRAQSKAEEANRKLGWELVAELGRPLREELPLAISTSISEAMQPILDKVSAQGTSSVSTMAHDLSQQVSNGVERALTVASDRIAQAGDRIAQLAERMDQSSGRMGTEMDQAVQRVAQAVDDLRGAMSATAQSTSGAFTQGAEQLLSVMNATLEGIRQNTGEGARAMSEAAADMRSAASSMREEMEGAARSGAEAAQARMQAAGVEAGAAIDGASRSVLEAFASASGKITTLTDEMFVKAGAELLSPISNAAEQLDALVGALEESAANARQTAESLRAGAQAGAEAAGTFRGASADLVAAAGPVRATTERIEGAIRTLSDSTAQVAGTVSRSAEATATSARQTLEAARETLGAQQRSIEAALQGVESLVRRMQGQGERLDTLDEKLGRAFELYANQTEGAMQSIRAHVVDMSKGLNTALATLQTIVDQLQEFQPQQGRR